MSLVSVRIAPLVLAAALALACARTPQVQYGDAGAVETVNVDFGSTDLQMIAEKMVDSLASDPYLPQTRPMLYVHQVRNDTDEHVDVKAITDTIRTALIRSRKFRFTAATEVNDELIKQIEYQVSSGYVNPDTARKFGQQIGGQYFLYGRLSNIRKQAGRVEDVFIQFTLNLVNIETGEIEWADQKDIRKTAKRPMVGR